jgi:hypothetical protein
VSGARPAAADGHQEAASTAGSRTTGWLPPAGSGRPPLPPAASLLASTTAGDENTGDRHVAAQRHLFNKLIGQLYHCVQHRQTFDSAKAFPLLVRSAAA